MTFDPILGNVSNKWEIGSENIMCGLTKNQKTKKPKNKKQKNKKTKNQNQNQNQNLRQKNHNDAMARDDNNQSLCLIATV
jgi:hypothetical protein